MWEPLVQMETAVLYLRNAYLTALEKYREGTGLRVKFSARNKSSELERTAYQ